MKDLYNSYKNTQEKVLNRIKEIDYDIKHNKGCKQNNLKLRMIYEREYMEITQVLFEIEDYLKEVSK